MGDEPKTYQEKVRELNRLREELARQERALDAERKKALEQRKALTRHPHCEAIINRYSLIAAAVGLLPGAGLNAAALTGVQIKMIDALAEQFGKNYTEEEARHTLTALSGGVLAPVATPAVAGTALLIPLVGPALSIVAGPAAAAASTRLVGHLALERLEKEDALASGPQAPTQSASIAPVSISDVATGPLSPPPPSLTVTNAEASPALLNQPVPAAAVNQPNHGASTAPAQEATIPYVIENQWGGSAAPWHPGGMWMIGGRSGQPVVAIDVTSPDDGATLTGTMVYRGEGPIGFRGRATGRNNYIVENQWGGGSAPWHPGGTWVLGNRDNQPVVAINVTSPDDGATLTGTMVYKGEGPIGFKGRRAQ
jgi:uncharacterized protein (DUF697 family)